MGNLVTSGNLAFSQTWHEGLDCTNQEKAAHGHVVYAMQEMSQTASKAAQNGSHCPENERCAVECSQWDGICTIQCVCYRRIELSRSLRDLWSHYGVSATHPIVLLLMFHCDNTTATAIYRLVDLVFHASTSIRSIELSIADFNAWKTPVSCPLVTAS